VAAVFASFRSRAALQLEILVFSAINSAFSTAVKRPKLTPADRLLWAGLCAVWNDWQSSILIVKVSTVIGWHRKGFRLFWAWKVRQRRFRERPEQWLTLVHVMWPECVENERLLICPPPRRAGGQTR